MEYIKSIENINELSPIEFDREMLKLFALFKDAHTSYIVPRVNLKNRIKYLDNKFYIFDNGEYKEIIKLGSIEIPQLLSQLKELVNFETEEWLNVQINNLIVNHYIWEMLKIADFVETKDGNKIKISVLQKSQSDKFTPYEFEIMNGDILYVRYSSCRENPEYLFKDFVQNIAEQVENKKIKYYILDVRNNTGGNSEILNPFQDLVRKKCMQGVLLINNKVFSSGRFSVARFKKEFNTPLIGTPTGGAVKSYGYIKPLEIDGKKFSASIRLWDFSDIFGYTGAIQPDIFVKSTIQDIQDNKDRALKVALDKIKEMKQNKSAELSH